MKNILEPLETLTGEQMGDVLQALKEMYIANHPIASQVFANLLTAVRHEAEYKVIEEDKNKLVAQLQDNIASLNLQLKTVNEQIHKVYAESIKLATLATDVE